MAYGLDKQHKDANILVYDLGGGTFDVTLLTIDDGTFEVLSTSGDTHLGGEDFDQRVMKYFIKKIQKSGQDVSKDSRALQKLRKEVERVKRSLSTQTQARVEIDDLVPGFDFVETLTRARFEELNNDLFQKTLGPVQTVLNNAEMSPSDIDRIVLVGGSTRIPKIQSLLSDFFGKPVYTGIDPDEAVAKGAAIQAANLSGQHNGELDGVILLDAVSLSMGIETVGGIMTKIVPRDSFLPTRKSQTFSTHVDNQSTVTILVFEGERGMTKDNHLLGKFELTGIPPAPRGIPQIEVTFDVDVNNILEVSAVDKGTGKAEKITITAVQGQLSKEQIDQMAKEAEMYAEDKKQVERIQSRNALESYVHNLKNTLDEEDGGRELSISPAEKKELRDIAEETLDWLEEHQDAEMEEFKVKVKEIQAVANPLMMKAYGGAGDRNAEAEEDFYDEDL
jgi:heat shock protein 5